MPDVAIAGCGLCCSLGLTVDEVFAAMCAGRDGFRPIHRFDAEPYAQKQAGMLSAEAEARLLQRVRERERHLDDADLATALVLAAGNEALAQAGYTPETLPPDTGLVLGSNFGDMELLEWLWRERLDTAAIDPRSFEGWSGFHGTLAARLGCTGPLAHLSLSCASGAAVAALAKLWIDSGRCRRVLVVAYDTLTRFTWTGLHNLRTITPDTLRPFDRRRSGTLFSEGAAAMLLAAPGGPEQPLAVLKGAATDNNAFHMTAPCKEGEGSRRVMAAALRDAGLGPEAVDHVCAHATATTANDPTECAAIRNLLGAHAGDVTVSGHKSQLGHLLGAAGLAEAVVSVQMLRTRRCPPTIHLDDQDPECPLQVPTTLLELPELRTILTNSAGIGGNNASLVLQAPGTLPDAAQPAAGDGAQAVEIVSAGWVLGSGFGSSTDPHALGRALAAAEAETLPSAELPPDLFHPKGYLDPSAAWLLGAAALALRELAAPPGPETAVVSATHLGPLGSGFAFFSQMESKGVRLASPMIFPHAYASTPGNLLAIEHGYAGPHLVFCGGSHTGGAAVAEAAEAARQLLLQGKAGTVLLAVYESARSPAIPDGIALISGAVVLALRLGPAGWTPAKGRTAPPALGGAIVELQPMVGLA